MPLARSRLEFGRENAFGVREGSGMQRFTGQAENAISALLRVAAVRERGLFANWQGVMSAGSAPLC